MHAPPLNNRPNLLSSRTTEFGSSRSSNAGDNANTRPRVSLQPKMSHNSPLSSSLFGQPSRCGCGAMMTAAVLVVLVVGLIREGAILEPRCPRSPAIARIGMLRPAIADELQQQRQQQQDGAGENAPASYLDWGAQLAVDEASRPWRFTDVDVGPIDRPLVTFMVTANVVPTIPSTCIIGMTLDSLPQGSVKLVFLDKYGVTKHGNTTPEAYDEFQRRIEMRKDVQLVARVPDDAPGTKLQRVLQYGLQFVKTPFVVAVQHDMPFKYPGTINFTAMAIDMARFPELKYVLFNFWSDNNMERDRTGVFDASKASEKALSMWNRIVGDEFTSYASNVTYTRTMAWSDNNYMCRTRYLQTVASMATPFAEWGMKSHTRNELLRQDKWSWREYGLWRYGPVGFPRQLLHLEGRKTKNISEVVPGCVDERDWTAGQSEPETNVTVMRR